MESERTADRYSRSGIRRILGIHENRLRAWERLGLAEAKADYTFSDLISLKTLQGIYSEAIPRDRIQQVLGQLRQRLATAPESLTELKVVARGRRIELELQGDKIEGTTGQLMFQFDVERLRAASIVELQEARQAFGAAEGSEALFQRALELESSGASLPEVCELYRQVIECDPAAAGAMVNLGTLHFRQGEADEAERRYRDALQINPDYALAHYNLANICDTAGRLQEAAEHYSDALRCCPDYADAHYNLALVEERIDRPAEAAKHWRAYLQLDPSSQWAKVATVKLRELSEAVPSADQPAGITFRKPFNDADE